MAPASFKRGAGHVIQPRFDQWPEADIAISGEGAFALSVRAADCVPVLLADRRTGAAAAIHAGWKGTAAGAVMAAVQAMAERYGTDAGDVVAAVGPSIGPCCYEVGAELIPRFDAHADAAEWFTRDGTIHLDLWRANRDQFERAGVPPGQIHVCRLCTSDYPNLFHSYRRDRNLAGRLVAAIRPNPVSPEPQALISPSRCPSRYWQGGRRPCSVRAARARTRHGRGCRRSRGPADTAAAGRSSSRDIRHASA